MLDIPELEEVEWPEAVLDPNAYIRKGLIKGWTDYAHEVTRALPQKFLETARQKLAAEGICDEPSIALKSISLMASWIETFTSRIPSDLYRDIQRGLSSMGAYDEEAVISIAMSELVRAYNNRKKFIDVYTEETVERDSGSGGWCATVIREDESEQILSGSVMETAKNRTELVAVTEALKSISKPSYIRIHSASMHIIHGVNRGWAQKWKVNGWKQSTGKPVLNSDLWQELLDAIDKHKQVIFLLA